MELERDLRVVVIVQLDDEQYLELTDKKQNEMKIRLNNQTKAVPDLYSPDNNDDDVNRKDSEYIDGFRMKTRFIKSDHMLAFTKEQDRLIEITEPTRRRSYIDIHKHYPINSFDLYILTTRFTHSSMSSTKWWSVFKTLIPTPNDDSNEKQIQLLCAPAFNLPLPKQLARQTACLIKFYEMFRTTLFSLDHVSSSSLLSKISYILPAIQLSFRPQILRWFDERIHTHHRLKSLLNNNCVCLVACGSKRTSFEYDFSLLEFHIISQFNASEWELSTLVKRFAMKYLRCPLDNYFLRTTVLWICEIHDLENYHHIFEVWISFMRDVCRKHFLPHYFLENVNVYEERAGLEDIINTIDYRNIDVFIDKLKENLIFPYVYQYHERMERLATFFECQPVLALKMKVVYNVIVKSQFVSADSSLSEMCSILCHLSFLEDDQKEYRVNFWQAKWKPLFCDFDRDDIVLRQPKSDFRPEQLAQQMTESVLKLIQMDLSQLVNSTQS